MRAYVIRRLLLVIPTLFILTYLVFFSVLAQAGQGEAAEHHRRGRHPAVILVAIFADVLAPYPHDEVNIVDRMQAPSNRYLLGTDQLGRDLLSRLVFGARISLTVGLAATTVNVVVAVLIGGISGFFGRRLDLAMQRFVDAWMAFPGLLLLLTIMSLVGRGLPQIIVVLGVRAASAAREWCAAR